MNTMEGRDYEQGYFDGYDRLPPKKDTSEYQQGYEVGVRVEQPTVFYHRTDSVAAILQDGFRDSEGSFGIAGVTLCGVFMSDVPLDVNDGVSRNGLFEITPPADIDMREYELVQPRSHYREWCVPAEIVNGMCAVRQVKDD